MSLWESLKQHKPMKRINGKTFLRSDILSLKEKEQIHNDISKDEETEEKTKLQQTDILMNECQLPY